MANDHISEATKLLDYYLDASVEAEYAVMLSAPWGAGKTHFIKKYLDERFPRPKDETAPSYLYASLFGVSATSAINDQFFNQLYPKLDSKTSKVLGTFASGWFEKVFGAKGSTQMLKDLFIKLDGKILIIDDLERCSMKISDVMGFINTFVEHQKLKVIILANEREIPPAQIDEYYRQKEKLIGKTMEVRADPAEILEKLTDAIKSKAVREIVSSHKGPLLATFNASKKPNYRNLRAVLADFERLVGAVDQRLRDTPIALKQLLLYMTATGCEARASDLTEQTLRGLPTTSFTMGSIFSKSIKTPEDEIFEQLQTRYVEVRWIDPIISPAHLADLFFSGRIAVEKINEGLLRHPDVVGHARLPAWRSLWDWAQRGRHEYEKARAELLRDLADEKIIHPGIILHVAGIVLSLRDNGDAILGEDTQIGQYFEGYVSRLVNSKKLAPNHGTFGFDSMSAAGLGYASEGNPEFKPIYAMVKDACAEVERMEMVDVARGYVDRLATDPDSYASLYNYGVHEGNYRSTPFLHHIDVKDFARLLIVDSRSNDRLFASLMKRYEHDYAERQVLQAEYDWVESLRTHLLAVADADSPPFSCLLRKRVSYYFDPIREGIAQSEASN